jgi:hypothetical protein
MAKLKIKLQSAKKEKPYPKPVRALAKKKIRKSVYA